MGMEGGLYFPGAGIAVPCWSGLIWKAVEKEPFIWLNTFSEPSDRLYCDTLNSVWISVFLYSLPYLNTER